MSQYVPPGKGLRNTVSRCKYPSDLINTVNVSEIPSGALEKSRTKWQGQSFLSSLTEHDSMLKTPKIVIAKNVILIILEHIGQSNYCIRWQYEELFALSLARTAYRTPVLSINAITHPNSSPEFKIEMRVEHICIAQSYSSAKSISFHSFLQQDTSDIVFLIPNLPTQPPAGINMPRPISRSSRIGLLPGLHPLAARPLTVRERIVFGIRSHTPVLSKCIRRFPIESAQTGPSQYIGGHGQFLSRHLK